jgi:hypothetical protein
LQRLNDLSQSRSFTLGSRSKTDLIAESKSYRSAQSGGRVTDSTTASRITTLSIILRIYTLGVMKLRADSEFRQTVLCSMSVG